MTCQPTPDNACCVCLEKPDNTAQFPTCPHVTRQVGDKYADVGVFTTHAESCRTVLETVAQPCKPLSNTLNRGRNRERNPILGYFASCLVGCSGVEYGWSALAILLATGGIALGRLVHELLAEWRFQAGLSVRWSDRGNAVLADMTARRIPAMFRGQMLAAARAESERGGQ